MSLHVVLRTRGADGQTLQTADFDVGAGNPLTFGRAEDNRLPVPDTKKMVSSRHGRIERRGDDYFVVDSSTNGTHVAGVTLERNGDMKLQSGSAIALGDFEIVVTWGTAAAAEQPAYDAEMTMQSFDPNRLAAELWDELCKGHAGRRTLDQPDRAAQLRELAQKRLAHLPPVQQSAVLKRVLARSGHATDAEPSADEQLLEAGLHELRRLAGAVSAEARLARPADVKEFVGHVESYLRMTLEWLVQSLRGRAEFENQFGAEVTMVFQRSSNPLKGLQASELAQRLFGGDAGGDARSHLDGILRDLTQHQLGLLGGVKEAIRSVTERLSPEAIEELARKDAGWLTSKGAKAWEVYQQIYGEFLEEKGKLFHEVISPAIRKGYLSVHDDAAARRDEPPRDA